MEKCIEVCNGRNKSLLIHIFRKKRIKGNKIKQDCRKIEAIPNEFNYVYKHFNGNGNRAQLVHFMLNSMHCLHFLLGNK